jgi:hypothetical protein
VIHSGNATVQRREERLHIQARLAAIDSKLDQAMAQVRGAACAAPLFTDADVAEVGKLLVEGRLRLPRYATVTVTTEVEERKDPIFGTSTILHHTADELCCHALQPMSIQAAIERKLLTKVGGPWLFRADVYRGLVPADPRLVT